MDFSKRISDAAFKCGLKRTDGNGRTRLHYVATFGRHSFGNDAPGYEGFIAALECLEVLDDETRAKIRKYPQDVNARDNSGQTPLHRSFLYELAKGIRAEVDMPRALIESGADINAQDNEGSTPAHIAAVGGQYKLLEFAAENGANFNIKSNDGKTVAHVIGEHAQNYDLYQRLDEAIDVALSAGADFHEKDAHGKTALDYLTDHGHSSVATYIEQQSMRPKPVSQVAQPQNAPTVPDGIER